MQAKVAGSSHFLNLYLCYIPRLNKVLLKEMQKMQKVTFTDVYFRDRITFFISKTNTRFLLEKRMERLKERNKFRISQRELLHFQEIVLHKHTRICLSWEETERRVGAGHHTKGSGTRATRYLSAYPAKTNYLEGLPDVNILKLLFQQH